MNKFHTAIVERSLEGWYIGKIREYPEAITQGKSLDEIRANLVDCLSLLRIEQKPIRLKFVPLGTMQKAWRKTPGFNQA